MWASIDPGIGRRGERRVQDWKSRAAYRVLLRRGAIQHALHQVAVEQARRLGEFLLKRFRGRPQDFVEPAVQCGQPFAHQPIGTVQRPPSDQERQGSFGLLVADGHIERLLLSLKIVEIWQALEIGPQMLGAEKPLEVAPTYRLRVVLASHCLKRRDAQIGVGTFRVVVLETLARFVEPRQRLGGSVCVNQPLGDIEPVRALHPSAMDRGDECVCIVIDVGQQREPKGKMPPLCLALPVTGLSGAGDGFQRSLRDAPDFCSPGHTQRYAHVRMSASVEPNPSRSQ